MTKLSKPQVEILQHRLGSGCVADVLWESEVVEDVKDAEAAVAAVQAYVEKGELPEDDGITPLEREVLADCLDGSTFFANIDDAVALSHVNRGQFLSWRRAATELETLISRLCGRQVSCVVS